MGQPGAGQAAQRAGTRLMSRGHSVSGAMRPARRSGRAYLRWTTIAAQIDLTAPVTLNVLDLQSQFRASPAAYLLWSLKLSNLGYCLTGQFVIEKSEAAGQAALVLATGDVIRLADAMIHIHEDILLIASVAARLTIARTLTKVSGSSMS
jgi:hypothetical protein